MNIILKMKGAKILTRAKYVSTTVRLELYVFDDILCNFHYPTWYLMYVRPGQAAKQEKEGEYYPSPALLKAEGGWGVVGGKRGGSTPFKDTGNIFLQLYFRIIYIPNPLSDIIRLAM